MAEITNDKDLWVHSIEAAVKKAQKSALKGKGVNVCFVGYGARNGAEDDVGAIKVSIGSRPLQPKFLKRRSQRRLSTTLTPSPRELKDLAKKEKKAAKLKALEDKAAASAAKKLARKQAGATTSTPTESHLAVPTTVVMSRASSEATAGVMSDEDLHESSSASSQANPTPHVVFTDTTSPSTPKATQHSVHLDGTTSSEAPSSDRSTRLQSLGAMRSNRKAQEEQVINQALSILDELESEDEEEQDDDDEDETDHSEIDGLTNQHREGLVDTFSSYIAVAPAAVMTAVNEVNDDDDDLDNNAVARGSSSSDLRFSKTNESPKEQVPRPIESSFTELRTSVIIDNVPAVFFRSPLLKQRSSFVSPPPTHTSTPQIVPQKVLSPSAPPPASLVPASCTPGSVQAHQQSSVVVVESNIAPATPSAQDQSPSLSAEEEARRVRLQTMAAARSKRKLEEERHVQNVLELLNDLDVTLDETLENDLRNTPSPY